MANISSYFGGSGGGGTVPSYMRNSCNVPLPNYITEYRYKCTCCTEAVSSTPICCGVHQAGLIPLENNNFVVLIGDFCAGGGSCNRLFAKAFCIDDDSGIVCSAQTGWSLVIDCCICDFKPFGGDANCTPTISDGCKTIYMGSCCCSDQTVTVLCVNCNDKATAVCFRYMCCLSCNMSNDRLCYGGTKGVINIYSDTSNSCPCGERWEDGSRLCRYCITGCNACQPHARGTRFLNSETMLTVGLGHNSGHCTTLDFKKWDPNSNVWRSVRRSMHCYASSTSISRPILCVQKCRFHPAGIQQSVYVGKSFWKHGPAFWMGVNDCSYQICQFVDARSCTDGCSTGLPNGLKPFFQNALFRFDNPSNMVTYVDHSYGLGQECFSGSCGASPTQFRMKLNFNDSFDANFLRRSLKRQANGVLSKGMFPVTCYFDGTDQFSCEQCSAHFTSYETEQDSNRILMYRSVSDILQKYEYPLECRLNYSDGCVLLGSGVVGDKWTVAMESSGCNTCMCIYLHVYKMMTEYCTE